MKRKTKSARPRRARTTKKWSARVTRTSDAMDLKPNVFKQGSAKAIARSVKRSSKNSRRRKSNAYRSAVSMVSFYENRAGKNLSPKKRATLQNAKKELKKAFGRTTRSKTR